MTRTHFSITTDIPTPLALVWSVLADVAHWPEWTESVSRVKMLSPGLLQVGSRVRIHQPKLPPAYWRVTELDPGASFTWISRAPGVRVTARHMVEAIPAGTHVTLSVHYGGWMAGLLARWTGELNDRYLAMEAGGLKARCAELAARLVSEHTEAH
jgi:uncharacterized membrane protein